MAQPSRTRRINPEKGMSIYLEGKLTHRSWQDNDGNTRYSTEVVGSYFRIISKKEPGQPQQNGQGRNSTQQSVPQPQPVTEGAPSNQNGDDSDLPF